MFTRHSIALRSDEWALTSIATPSYVFSMRRTYKLMGAKVPWSFSLTSSTIVAISIAALIGCGAEEPSAEQSTKRQEVSKLNKDDDPHSSPEEDVEPTDEKLIDAASENFEIPPGLKQILDRTDQISDGAQAALEDALKTADPHSENTRAAEALLKSLPEEAYILRRRLIFILGEIGTEENLDTLKRHAISGYFGNASPPSSDDAFQDYQARAGASLALTRMVERSVPTADESAAEVIRSAPEKVAVFSAVELYSKGLLSETNIKDLKQRGLPHAFKQREMEKLDPSELTDPSNPEPPAIGGEKEGFGRE